MHLHIKYAKRPFYMQLHIPPVKIHFYQIKKGPYQSQPVAQLTSVENTS